MDDEQPCLWCVFDGCGVCGNFAETNVIRIDDGRPFNGDPAEIDERQQSTIDCLENLIEMVHSGQASGVCVVFGVPLAGTDSILTTGSVTSEHIHDYPHTFLGGLTRLQHRINVQMDDDMMADAMEFLGED